MNEEDHSEMPSPPNLPPPQSFRKGLVYGVGFGLLLVAIITANTIWRDFNDDTSFNAASIFLIIFSIWGIFYIIYLLISFFLIAAKKLPGCEFTAITHGLLKKDVHVCVDSILNSRLDNMQKEIGISTKLLRTESAQKWIAGLVLLFILVSFLTINIVDSLVKLEIIGVFSSIYFLYDITIHRFSIDRKDLTGKGDYPRLTLQYLIALLKEGAFKKS
jgi:hypothetical protein